jgi:hypothetical protein
MLIKACLQCKFHETKRDKEGQMSYCQKENCWAQYSKCVVYKALDRFLKDEFFNLGYVSQLNTPVYSDNKK